MLQEFISQQPSIETERLVLRPLRRSDMGLFELAASDLRVAGMTRSIPHPLPPGASEALIAQTHSTDRAEDVWALDGIKSGLPELCGCMGLTRLDRSQSEVDYWLAPAVWNMGLAREALTALLAANTQSAETVFGSVFQDNTAAARVLTHCGFDYLGDAESFSVARNATVPTWTYTKRLVA